MDGWRRLILICMSLLLVAGSVVPAHSRTSDDVQSEQQRTKTELTGIQREEVEVLQDLFRMNRSLQELEADIQGLESQRGAVLIELESLALEQARMQDQFRRRRQLFGRRVRFYYAEGASGLLEIVLAASDFADFLDRIYLLEIVVKADAALLASLRRLRVELDAQEAKLRRKDAELAGVNDSLVRRLVDLSVAIREREDRLVALRDRRASVELALTQLEQVWHDQVRPVLLAFGQAIHTLTLRGWELEPDAVQLQLVPPRIRFVVSDTSLNRFLSKDPALSGFKALLDNQRVTLAGLFSGMPLEMVGGLSIHQGVVLRFQPDLIRFFGVPLPAALAKELISTGSLDLNVADALRGGQLLEVKVEAGRVTALASLR